MEVNIAGNCLYLLQPVLPHCQSSSLHTVASVFSSLSSTRRIRRRGIDGSDRAITCHIAHQADHRSPFLGTSSTKLSRRRSLENSSGRRRGRSKGQALRRSFSASLEGFIEGDEEFLRQLQELIALKLRQEESEDSQIIIPESRDQESWSSSSRIQDASSSSVPSPINPLPHPRKPPEMSGWPYQDEIVPASVEQKAKSVDLPLSLRIIKRKKQRWAEGIRDAGESACCSVNKAFSSMVFIIRELQNFMLQMREILFYENLQGILARVQGEINASFVWLFQHIFSCTPTLMIYLMLLLVNFAVYSISDNAIIAIASPDPPPQSIVTVAVAENHQMKHQNPRFDPSSSSIKTFFVGGSGGGKMRPVAGATDDGRSDGWDIRRIIPDEISTVPSAVTEEGGGEAAAVEREEEEAVVWNRIVEEASRMQARWRHDALTDPETLQRLVSPVSVELEPDDCSDYIKTEITYRQALSQDPENPLLLSNLAQFLYLVLHDHDRAEYYFKRAAAIKPADAESLSRYANFLWLARKDLGAAEETYLEAIAADPSNTYYAASYANFLWNTGGEDTCYPLDGSDA